MATAIRDSLFGVDAAEMNRHEMPLTIGRTDSMSSRRDFPRVLLALAAGFGLGAGTVLYLPSVEASAQAKPTRAAELEIGEHAVRLRKVR